MSVPSVKGSAMESVVADLQRLVSEGRIDPEELRRSLPDKDRELLDMGITPLTWFPVETYGRLLELLAREEGGDDPLGYLRARGARAAERLLSGTYESFAAEPGTWGPRVGQMMMGIAKLLYNFSSWSFRCVEDGVWEIEVREARELPDAARHTAQGFLAWFAERAAARPMRVASTRPSPDHIVYRIEPA